MLAIVIGFTVLFVGWRFFVLVRRFSSSDDAFAEAMKEEPWLMSVLVFVPALAASPTWPIIILAVLGFGLALFTKFEKRSANGGGEVHSLRPAYFSPSLKQRLGVVVFLAVGVNLLWFIATNL